MSKYSEDLKSLSIGTLVAVIFTIIFSWITYKAAKAGLEISEKKAINLIDFAMDTSLVLLCVVGFAIALVIALLLAWGTIVQAIWIYKELRR